MTRPVRLALSILVALAVVAGATVSAFAYFSSSGSAGGSVKVGTLNPPTAVSASSTAGTGAVSVSWTAPTGGVVPLGYYVTRSGAAACASSASALITSTSCTDSSVPLGTYTYTVVAVFRSWTATSAASSAVTVAQAAQAITFTSTPVTPTFGGTYTVTATGGASGQPVSFSSGSPSVCTVSTSTVSFVGAGSCSINANQAGSTYYSAAPQSTQAFTVATAAQTITFTSTAPSNATVGGASYTVTATGGASGSPVTFTIDATTSGKCSIAGAVVTFQHVGTCTIDANQAGNGNYAAANQVQQSFAVGQGAQAITFTSTAPSPATVGGATYAVTATGGGSGNAITFTSGSTSVCTVSGSTVSFIAVGTCLVLANQAGNTDYLAAGQVQQSITVAKGTQTITFTSTAPAAATVGGATYTVSATGGGSTSPVLFSSGTTGVCTVSGPTVTFVGAGTCTVNANQAGDANYNAANTVAQSFTVGKGAQTISFTSTVPSGATYGGTYTVSATSTSGLAVTFTSGAPTICGVSGSTVSFVGVGTCIVNADQVGNSNYLAAPQKQQSFTVAKANQTITFTAPATGSAPGSATISASSDSTLSVAVTSATTSVCTISATTVTYLAGGTCTLNANQAGNANYSAAAQVQRSITVTAFAITAKSAGAPQNSTSISGVGGTAGQLITVRICTGTQSSCTSGSGTLTSTISGTVASDGTWTAAANNNKIGTGTFTAQATQPTPAATSAVFVFTN